MRVRIITDDLTSALDGTASFAQRGWDTAALIQPDSACTAEVVSLDTDSREAPLVSGRDAVAKAADNWRHADVLALQFDSTLRGRVAHDCATARAASGRRKLLIAPAFPSAGRTTEAGRVLVEGVPVHETAFGRDPTLPVRESSIPALFRAQGIEVKVAHDIAHACMLLDAHNAVVVDAHTEADLDKLVDDFAMRDDLLWAGSTGLLRALARRLPLPSGARNACRPPAAVAHRPWLVVGSLNPRSRRQLDVARAQCRVNVLATSEARLASDALPHTALQELVLQTVDAVRNGTCDGLVVTGGETARRILDALPAISLRVCREIMPGVPLSEVRTAAGTFPMITKAGGFGDDEALAACIGVLTGAKT